MALVFATATFASKIKGRAAAAPKPYAWGIKRAKSYAVEGRQPRERSALPNALFRVPPVQT